MLILSQDSEDEFDQDLCLNLWYDLPLLLFIIPFPISQEELSPYPQIFLPFLPFSFRKEVSCCPGWQPSYQPPASYLF